MIPWNCPRDLISGSEDYAASIPKQAWYFPWALVNDDSTTNPSQNYFYRRVQLDFRRLSRRSARLRSEDTSEWFLPGNSVKKRSISTNYPLVRACFQNWRVFVRFSLGRIYLINPLFLVSMNDKKMYRI